MVLSYHRSRHSCGVTVLWRSRFYLGFQREFLKATELPSVSGSLTTCLSFLKSKMWSCYWRRLNYCCRGSHPPVLAASFHLCAKLQTMAVCLNCQTCDPISKCCNHIENTALQNSFHSLGPVVQQWSSVSQRLPWQRTSCVSSDRLHREY